MHMRSYLIIDSTPGTNYWLCCNVFNTQFSLTNQPFCTQVYVSHICTSNINTDANKSSTIYIVVLYKVSSVMLIQMFYSRNSQCMKRSLRSFYVIWYFHSIRVKPDVGKTNLHDNAHWKVKTIVVFRRHCYYTYAVPCVLR